MDSRLGELTGLETLEIILSVLPRTPVVMMSDFQETEEVIKAGQTGSL